MIRFLKKWYVMVPLAIIVGVVFYKKFDMIYKLPFGIGKALAKWSGKDAGDNSKIA